MMGIFFSTFCVDNQPLCEGTENNIILYSDLKGGVEDMEIHCGNICLDRLTAVASMNND